MTIPAKEPAAVGPAEPPTIAPQELEHETHRVLREQRPLTPLAHRCLGESLATAELEEGLAVLAARLSGLQLAGDPPVVSGSGGIRKVTPMRVRWAASA